MKSNSSKSVGKIVKVNFLEMALSPIHYDFKIGDSNYGRLSFNAYIN